MHYQGLGSDKESYTYYKGIICNGAVKKINYPGHQWITCFKEPDQLLGPQDRTTEQNNAKGHKEEHLLHRSVL